MIDLHLHTTYSDGRIGVKELLEKAQTLGLDVISITDHDSVEAYYELIENHGYKEFYDGDIVKGVELTMRLRKVDVHFLVYDYDLDKMNTFISKYYVSKEERNKLSYKMLVDKCRAAGLVFDTNNINIEFKKEYPVYKLFAELMQHEENFEILEPVWNDCSAFIYKQLKDPRSPFFIDMNNLIPNFNDVAQEIVDECKGKIFLAHPFNYERMAYKILHGAIDSGCLYGIECTHSNLTYEQSKFLQNLCFRYNFKMSGGSDYHAKNEDIYMGLGTENFLIPKAIISDWSKEYFMKEGDANETDPYCNGESV